MQINTSMTSSEVFGEISRAFFAHGDPLSDWTVIPWSRSRVKKLLFVDTARVVCGRIYVTAWCPSVCPICRPLRRVAAVGPAAARRTAANASSVTLSADVGGVA